MTEQLSTLINLGDGSVVLTSPTAMPMASSFLWNQHMLFHSNCRGYASAQFMQPEPAKYAYAPNIEAKTFLQPEQPYYAHHPGRFVYLRDLDDDTLFSAPHEPVRAKPDHFEYECKAHQINWTVIKNHIQVTLTVSLANDRPLELWEISVTNLSARSRRLHVMPYFPIGYMSWMHQAADFDQELTAIVARCITPYQKYQDYFKHQHFKDLTFLLADSPPNSYEARQSAFEGEGGLSSPDAVLKESFSNSDANYEVPTAAMLYKVQLKPNQQQRYRFAFGPATDLEEISALKQQLFGDQHGFDMELSRYQQYINKYRYPVSINSNDAELNNFVNSWLGRQIHYHGDVNRLSTDPQTRNFLQDNMGMAYINPKVAGDAFLLALSQQHQSGEMPDGVLLNETAELKYINQIPHMDHCVWLPICIKAYLDETNDYGLLEREVGFADDDSTATVFEHINRALNWLYTQRDERGLNYINQGDWCDPMNMVGYQGQGVSSWLTLAAAYAYKLWSQVCSTLKHNELALHFRQMQADCNSAVNKHAWKNNWYARGITDQGRVFGTESDQEGKIFLNPQSWAILSDAANSQQIASIINSVKTHLHTPYGVQMLAPAYTKMQEDIGRITQKHPGSAENGSVYNHAAAFYVYALYSANMGDLAYQCLREMIPGGDQNDYLQRGQLPVFIPNYYRGAYQQHKRTAGRSSQLFNTGTVHWVYRCIIECLFGTKGHPEGLLIEPQLPSHWQQATITRYFRDAEFDIRYQRDPKTVTTSIEVNGQSLDGNLIQEIRAGAQYRVDVRLPNDD